MRTHPDICVISTYLPLDAAQTAFWNDISDRLAARGVVLLLLTTTSNPGLRAFYMQIPYLLRDFAGEGPQTPAECYPSAYVDSDAGWAHTSAAGWSNVAGLARCVRFYRLLLDVLEPCAVFAWNMSVPQSRVLHAEAVKRGIPAFAIERGLFPNTIMVESRENGALSDLNANPVVLSAEAAFIPDETRVQAIREYYRTHAVAKYPARPRMSREEYYKTYGVDSKDRVIVVFASAAAANWLPRNFRGAQINSPYFGSLAEAVCLLRDALPENFRLAVQTHPIDGPLAGEVPPDVIVHTGHDIHTLLGVGEIYVFLGCTTVQYEALLYERPIVLLSRTQLSGKGIAYEYQGHDLKELIGAALREEGFPARRAAAERHVDFVFQHFLYGFNGAPTAHGLDDFANFIATWASGHGREPEQRLSELVSLVNTMT